MASIQVLTREGRAHASNLQCRVDSQFSLTAPPPYRRSDPRESSQIRALRA